MQMTLKDIAELVGVSPATVSLALNNKPGVSEQTRQTIIDLAQQSGYSKKFNKKNIMFIKYIGDGAAVEHNGDFVARIIDAIEETASRMGYVLVIKNIQSGELEREIRALCFDEVVGTILLATEVEDIQGTLLESIPVPLVAVDNMFETNDIDSVVMDNYGGIYSAVEHLYKLGHREIGYIDSTIRFSNFDQRREGFYRALEKFNLKVDEKYMYYIQANLQGAYCDMQESLKEGRMLPTAFVAANDTVAIGAIKALKEKGIDIPNQISFVGFDDIPFCRVLEKNLTTMNVDKEQLGEEAVKLLDRKITNETRGSIKILTRTKLMVRESTQVLNR